MEDAFTLLLETAGERVRLPSGETVLAVIRRDLPSEGRRRGLPDFRIREGTSIEIAKPTTAVTAGDVVHHDDAAIRYRVREVFAETSYSVRLNCEPSPSA